MKTFIKPVVVSWLIALILCVSWLNLSTSSVSGKGKPGGGGQGGGDKGPSYEIVELASAGGLLDSFPLDINSTGLVVGQVYSPDLDEVYAACWSLDQSNGTVSSTLHLLDGDEALSVNESGEIVGKRDGWAVYWNSRTAAPLVLPVPPGSVSSGASAINGDGVICGWSAGEPDSNGRIPFSALAWRVNIQMVDGQPTPAVWGPLLLTTSSPGDTVYTTGINDNVADGAAMVTGIAGDSIAVSWVVVSQPNGTLTVDSGPAVVDVQAYASAVNNSGAICGDRWIGDSFRDGVVWDGEATYTLKRAKWITGGVSARDINNNGVIVGAGLWNDNGFGYGLKAVVWPGATAEMIVLEKFLTNQSFSSLKQATAVNDFGVIAGWGSDNDRQINLGYVAIPK